MGNYKPPAVFAAKNVEKLWAGLSAVHESGFALGGEFPVVNR
jgi:hypothetical protein